MLGGHTMKTPFALLAIITVMAGSCAQASAEIAFFTVKVDAPQNGSLKIVPPLPADHKVPAGTVLKIKATPAPGFALDSGIIGRRPELGCILSFPRRSSR